MNTNKSILNTLEYSKKLYSGHLSTNTEYEYPNRESQFLYHQLGQKSRYKTDYGLFTLYCVGYCLYWFSLFIGKQGEQTKTSNVL